MTCTVAIESVQTPLWIVQRNTYVPTTLTVAVAPGELALVLLKVTVPGPLSLVHVPVPVVAVLPASVAASPHASWLVPALAGVGAVFTVNVAALVGTLLHVLVNTAWYLLPFCE